VIISYIGTPGSGKSYDAVNRIIENIRKGRLIYTNIAGMFDSVQKEALSVMSGLSVGQVEGLMFQMTADEVIHCWDFIKDGSMVVIDEVQDYFSNRDWQTEKNKNFAKWCATHRHHGIDIVLLTQHIDRVDAAVRAMVEWTYKYRKMNMFGKIIGDKSYMCLAFAGDDTAGYPMTKQTKTYDPKIFRCYKSYVSQDIKELKIAKPINIFRKPVFLMIPVVIGIFIYTFSHSSLATGDLFGSKKAAKVKKTVAEVQTKVKEVKKGNDVSTEVPADIKKQIAKLNEELKEKNDNPKEDEQRLWGARVIKDKETGKNHMYEGEKYVGWFRVEKEKKVIKKISETDN
jgi:zona occludens toxin (predicted ATPase)